MIATFDTNFFRAAATSEAESLGSGKAESLLAISEDKNSKLFGVTFSFKLYLAGIRFSQILS